MFFKFPYTDLYTLNLDWIIKTMKDYTEYLETLKSELPSAEDISYISENIPAIKEVIENIDQLVTSVNGQHGAVNLGTLVNSINNMTGDVTLDNDFVNGLKIEVVLQTTDPISSFTPANIISLFDSGIRFIIVNNSDFYTINPDGTYVKFNPIAPSDTLRNLVVFTTTTPTTSEAEYYYSQGFRFIQTTVSDIKRLWAIEKINNVTLLYDLDLYKGANIFNEIDADIDISDYSIETLQNMYKSGQRILFQDSADGISKFYALIGNELTGYDRYVEYNPVSAFNTEIIPAMQGDITNLKTTVNSLFLQGNNTNFSEIPNTKSLILSGTFILNSTYQMSNGQTIRGLNCTIIVQSGGRIKGNNNCLIDNIVFIGDWNPIRTQNGTIYTPILTEVDLNTKHNLYDTNNSEASEACIIYTTIAESENFKIQNCAFSNLNRTAIYINGGAHFSATSYSISNCHFKDVYNCITCFGEFGRIENNLFFRNIICIEIAKGNIAKIGNVFKENDCAIYFIDGDNNNAHGETVGCEIAHSGLFGIYAIEISAQTGEIFTGTQIVDSPIKALNGNSMIFAGCRIDTFFNISGTKNKICNNIIGISYLRNNNLYTVPDDTIIRDNAPINLATEAEINKQTQASTTALSAVSPYSGSLTLIYNPVTRIVTMTGYYRIVSGSIPMNTNLFDVIPENLRPKLNTGIYSLFTLSNNSLSAHYNVVHTDGTITQSFSSSITSSFFTGSYLL